jgi:calcineurin-like phosphoesterase family protein
MNTQLIAEWNAVVGPRADVWCLGDFAYVHKAGWPVEEIFAQLHGRKHLVAGNHDEKNARVMKLPWESVHDLVTIRHEGQRIVACHYPLETWKQAHHGFLHVHGHCHGTLKRTIPHRYDVGVDVWPYRPVAIETILRMANNDRYQPQDHHGAAEDAERLRERMTELGVPPPD